MFEKSKTAAGMVLRSSESRRGKPGDLPPGVNPDDFTDEEGRVVAIEEFRELEPMVRAQAHQIAKRLSIPKPQRVPRHKKRGAGLLMSLPYRGGSDEIDIDKTIEVLAERPVPDDEDIIVHERVKTTRQVVLLVDVSGSMKGQRIHTAAAVVGALAGELQRDQLGVIAFWSNAAIMLPLGHPVKPMELLDDILRIPAKGLTNVAFPLELALKELQRVPGDNARVVLLSDCVHNAGPDPRPLAARLPRLDVLLDASGERDEALGAELAARGHGSYAKVENFRQVAPALQKFFRD